MLNVYEGVLEWVNCLNGQGYCALNVAIRLYAVPRMKKIFRCEGFGLIPALVFAWGDVVVKALRY